MSMKLNPDKEKRREVAQAVVANDGYCPCLIVRNEDTKCPCKAMREEGRCICGLYVNVVEDKKEIAPKEADYIVIGNKNCCQCKICVRKLANMGIKYVYKDFLELSDEDKDLVMRLAEDIGQTQFPIVLDFNTGTIVKDWRLL